MRMVDMRCRYFPARAEKLLTSRLITPYHALPDLITPYHALPDRPTDDFKVE
jgi:hypothetical protein